ncbi:nitroreductase [Paenibacillaceae bacterium]|nr:nitroreductase [Paenibacillaceae bacterium]
MSSISFFKEVYAPLHFDGRPVGRDLVLSILDDAVWAPNHRLREPWRFICAENEAKEKLIRTLNGSQHAKLANMLSEAPLVLIVTAKINKDDYITNDDFAAACCLIQNIQLLGWNYGLGMVWELADYTNCPALLAAADVQAEERIAGIIGLGYFNQTSGMSNVPSREIKLEVW